MAKRPKYKEVVGWRLVCQPNGLLARFLDDKSVFTHGNLSQADAIRVCNERKVDPLQTCRMISAARDEYQGDGDPVWLRRYKVCIAAVAKEEGENVAKRWDQILSQPDKSFL